MYVHVFVCDVVSSILFVTVISDEIVCKERNETEDNT